MKKFIVKANFLIAVALVSVLVLSGCTAGDNSSNPGAWGYDCKVMYNALGGLIGSRELRTTYYMSNSYVYRPAGTSGMLVTPSRDAYLLAGWYTSAEEAAPESVEEYFFDAQSRWDFSIDRVQEESTLYARWIPRGHVKYINAENGDILFEKYISETSTITRLSSAVESAFTTSDTTSVDYFEDEACTIPYDFGSFVFVDPNPSEQMLYDSLYEQFPQYFEQIVYTAPIAEDAGEEDGEEETIYDTSWLFLNKLGYALTEEGEAAVEEIQEAKNNLVEERIQAYLDSTADQKVYLRFNK